jgi:uncharacterized integral membrane protein
MDDPSVDGDARPPDKPYTGERRTRLSAAWLGIIAGIFALLVVLIFILQNLQNVKLSFLRLHIQLPLGVALLFAVILGAVIVVAIGSARIVQLRMVAIRARHRGTKSKPSPSP